MEQEHILNTHFDQLAAWWENAEDAPASPGDSIIERHVCERDGDTHYTIGVHREGMRGLIGKSGTRILARAPKPKPAWHDAIAVIATADVENGDAFTFIWAPDGQSEYWESCEGLYVKAEALRDVTPLIEAKVTDEMVGRALAEAESCGYIERVFGDVEQEDRDAIRSVVTAALGLDPA